MAVKTIEPTPLAYDSPLLINPLLDIGVTLKLDQEIVCADRKRMTYRELKQRVARMGSGLHGPGVEEGDTVAVMDWDTHRYLECYFAVPMTGAILHTVNVRLSAEQILCTINHAKVDVILVKSKILPTLEEVWDRIEPLKKLVLLDDIGQLPPTRLPVAIEYEALLRAGDPDFEFPEVAQNTRAKTIYTTGTTGLPKGVFFSHRQLVLHTFAALGSLGHGRFNPDDVYMPITPMFHDHAWAFPYQATTLGVKPAYPSRNVSYAPERIQGTPIGMNGGQRWAIVHHWDVRPMPMTRKAQTEAMRAVAYTTARSIGWPQRHLDAGVRAYHQARLELLTPVAKGWSSELSINLTSLGLQVHGGMGYVEETGAAQYFRDARITTNYEGATGIQAGDLVGREIFRDGGRAALAAKVQLGAGERDARFLAGKIVTARIHASQVMPQVHGLLPTILGGSEVIMALDEDQLRPAATQRRPERGPRPSGSRRSRRTKCHRPSAPRSMRHRNPNHDHRPIRPARRRQFQRREPTEMYSSTFIHDALNQKRTRLRLTC